MELYQKVKEATKKPFQLLQFLSHIFVQQLQCKIKLMPHVCMSPLCLPYSCSCITSGAKSLIISCKKIQYSHGR